MVEVCEGVGWRCVKGWGGGVWRDGVEVCEGVEWRYMVEVWEGVVWRGVKG
jgi:hypothetical protein